MGPGGGTRCEKSNEENTADGAACARLKEHWADSDMTPRLSSSTIGGGIKVSPASVEDRVKAMVTDKEGMDTYFQVNSASPMSATR